MPNGGKKKPEGDHEASARKLKAAVKAAKLTPEQAKAKWAAIQKQTWTISSTMIDFPQEDYSTLESIKVTGGIAPD